MLRIAMDMVHILRLNNSSVNQERNCLRCTSRSKMDTSSACGYLQVESSLVQPAPTAQLITSKDISGQSRERTNALDPFSRTCANPRWIPFRNPTSSTFVRAGASSTESRPHTVLQKSFSPIKIGLSGRGEEAISYSRTHGKGLVYDPIGPIPCTPTTRKTCRSLPLPQARS